MRNLELKWRCADLEAARRGAERLGARDSGLLLQQDTFFHAPEARLKLRDFGGGTGELISYRRPDAATVRGSDYEIYRTREPEALAAVLKDALGERGVVRKRRRLFLLDHTRIHLDEVEGLGGFVELETVLSGQSEAEARTELERIAEGLGLSTAGRVAEAYLDLLNAKTG
jgi:predicted adenylyl cyclase CyaB